MDKETACASLYEILREKEIFDASSSVEELLEKYNTAGVYLLLEPLKREVDGHCIKINGESYAISYIGKGGTGRNSLLIDRIVAEYALFGSSFGNSVINAYRKEKDKEFKGEWYHSGSIKKLINDIQKSQKLVSSQKFLIIQTQQSAESAELEKKLIGIVAACPQCANNQKRQNKWLQNKNKNKTEWREQQRHIWNIIHYRHYGGVEDIPDDDWNYIKNIITPPSGK